MALWKLHGDGTLTPGAVVAPDERLSWGKTVGLGAQHVVAMFGATFVFPILMGLNPQLAVMMSGIATLIFLAVVKGRVPSYLGSSASFVGVATAIYAAGGNPSHVSGAMFWVGVALLIAGVIIHFAGAGVIHRALPPVVTGAVVMLIGFNLAPVVANTYWPQDQWVGLVTMLLGVVALVMGGHVHQLYHLLEGIHGHVLAVDQLQIRLRGVAVLLGGGVELLHSGIQLLLSVLIGAHAVGLSLLGGQHVHGQLLHRGVADILLPCDITLVLDTQRGLHGVAHHLLVQGFGRIDAVKAGIAALQQTALHVGVEILHLPGGIFLTVDGHGGGAALQHAGVIHQQYRGHDHEHAGDHAVQDIVLACLGLLLRLADLLGVGNALCRQILTGLLFS